ncbi:MAG TPA: hypothetical protein VII99_16245 [Bacteroidia bacterium]
MKKILLVCSVALFLASCAVSVAPPYTKVESIARINPGMSASDVASTLGIPPFDIYHMAGDGSTVHMYYYKLKERKNKGCSLFMKNFYSKEENLTVGSSYYSKEQRLYVLFQNGKVSSLVTDAGRNDSEDLLVQNNTIQFISKTNRHALNYEKLELGQQLVKLDNKGNFSKTGGVGFMGKEKTMKKGCLGGGCFGAK